MSRSGRTPSEHYAERLGRREVRLTEYDTWYERLGSLRLLLAAIFLGLAWVCAQAGAPSAAWLVVPACAFAGTVVWHQRIRRLRALARRSVQLYRVGLARLGGGEPAGGPTGEAFLDEHHLYAADLDLFGKGGLYHHLCAARTPMGEATLARWLLQPAALDTIRERQACVVELRDRLDFREDLAVVGDAERIALQPEALERWLSAPDELTASWLPLAARGLALLAGVAAVVWAVWGIAFPFLAVLAVEALLNFRLRERVLRAVAGVEHAYEDLKLLASLLRRVEAESFETPALRALAGSLRSDSLAASVTLSKLATLVNFVEARRNPFLAPLMLPLLYTLQAAVAAEGWRRRHGRVVRAWLAALGEFEALTSMARYGFERPADPFPEFVHGPARFTGIALGHPSIADVSRVRNDVELDGATRVLLVSGSNMSGKSTLLRSVGMNTVLAMMGAPVCAARLELTPLQVGASIRVNDSLREGSSRFYAEITRLKQLFEPSPLPLLFLLDELLQGTNSNDRRIGAHGVVRALIGRGAIGLVSTHDLALTEDAELPAGALRNVHFEDQMADGKLSFDFRLREGVVTKSNGIELMRAIGLDV